MDNIGFVLYKKGIEPGTLNAKWNHSTLGSGRGIASGGSAEDFVGNYRIRYFNENGEVVADRDLEILKNGDNFSITWSKDNKVTAIGIGILVEDGLAAGWKNV